MNAFVSQLRESDYVIMALISVFWIALLTGAAAYTDRSAFLLLIPLFTIVSIAIFACVRVIFGLNGERTPRNSRESVPRTWRPVNNR